ncbi:hypothetical protein LJR011_001510 [Agrobacterium tumefaciens]
MERMKKTFESEKDARLLTETVAGFKGWIFYSFSWIRNLLRDIAAGCFSEAKG